MYLLVAKEENKDHRMHILTSRFIIICWQKRIHYYLNINLEGYETFVILKCFFGVVNNFYNGVKEIWSDYRVLLAVFLDYIR